MNNLKVRESSNGYYNVVCSSCGGTNFYPCSLFCKDCTDKANGVEKTGLVIKDIGNPERCEICHQSDMFDQLENTCKRCENVDINPQTQVAIPKQMKPHVEADVLVMILLVTFSTFFAIKVYNDLPIHLWIGFLLLLTLISYKISGKIAYWLYGQSRD